MSDREPEEKQRETSPGDISRREWLLKLGEAAFVFGFSGSAGEVAAKASAALGVAAPDLRALPPGLYEPSGEHMAHALTSDERYVKIPPGSPTDFVQRRQGAFHPLFFDEREFQVVRRLVTIVLGPPPKATAQTAEADADQTVSDIAEWIDLVLSQAAAVREAARQLSPEHRTLAVEYYGREAVEKLESAAPDSVCRKGLRWFDEKSKEVHGAPFIELKEPMQIKVAKLAGSDGTRPALESDGAEFLAYLKSETLRGFYTSRLGLNEIGYRGNYFYVECPGCKAQGSS
jgi:hypothetical protein